MKLAAKTRYGLRFMIDLAEHYGEGYCALKAIAERQNISKKYLEQLVSPLVSAELVKVSRGHKGGYALSRAPELITCAQIVAATEDGLELLDKPTRQQELSGGISSQYVWEGLESTLKNYLGSITLQDILEHEAQANMYCI